MQDSPGPPNSTPGTNGHEKRPPQDALQEELFVSTADAATLLNVNVRTVRNYISDGIHTSTGIVKLAAQETYGKRGKQILIAQRELERFKQIRDNAATEGRPAGTGAAAQAAESQALTTSIQIISAELERRNLALAEAQQKMEEAQKKIEQLSREAGRSEGLAAQVALLQERVKELAQERDNWQQQALRKQRFRVQLFPIKDD